MSEDPLEELLKLKAGGQDPLDELIASKSQPITPGHSKFTPEQLAARADRSVAQSEDELEAAGGYDPTTHKIMGTTASLAREVPGAEAVQAFLASRVNKIPYREALGTIRDVESDAGAWGTAARIGGGALTAAVLPGSPVVQGASYGALSGLGQAGPASVEERMLAAAAGATIGAIAPKVPGLARWAGRGAVRNAAAAGDVALLPFSHGARVRTVGRLTDLAREAATKAGAKAAPDVATAAPMVEGYRPIGEMIERAPTRVLPFRAPATDSPKAQFAALLQKNLDEGMEAAESVKGYPIRNDPPSNPELMRRIEAVLLRAKGGAGTARATPRKGITTPPRTVADVLKGKNTRGPMADSTASRALNALLYNPKTGYMEGTVGNKSVTAGRYSESALRKLLGDDIADRLLSSPKELGVHRLEARPAADVLKGGSR